MEKIFDIAETNLVNYWKQFGIQEKDFYCRECGNLLINLKDLDNVKYNFNMALPRTRFIDITNNNTWTEPESSRWCIKGRNLSGKVFFRHLCWDCFFKHLPEIEDIQRRARKSGWYAAVMRGEHPVPKAWTSPSAYFKLLFDITDNELQAERSKFDTASYKSFIKRYGEELGGIKYEEYRKRQAYTCSKEYMIHEKHMTETDWNNYNILRASTKQNFIRRYGKELGETKWTKYCENEAYAGCSLEYFQNTYGKEIGTEYYYKVCHQKACTLSNFIKKYGDELGKIKYENLMHRPDKVGYSVISQKLFTEIDAKLSNFAVNSKWQTKNFEQDIEIEIDGIKKFAKPDYILDKKIIEFNGDYWHANPVFYKSTDSISYPDGIKLASEIWLRDAKRLNALKALNYNVLVIWENDYNINHDSVITKCINFLKS